MGHTGNIPEGEMADPRIDVFTVGRDRPEWDDFVRCSPQAAPFVSASWISAVEQAVGIKADLWVAARGSVWQAAAPVFFHPSAGRKRGCLPPLTPYTSWLYLPPATSYPSRVTSDHVALTKSLIAAMRRKYTGIVNSLDSSIGDVRPWLWSGWKAMPRYTYLMDLGSELRCSHAVRKHVGKCRRAGFSLSCDWSLDEFWAICAPLLQRRRFDLGLNREAFFRLAESLHQAGLAWMVRAISPDGETAAIRIEVSLAGATTLYDWVAASSEKYLAQGVNSWLMMQTMEIARGKGFRTWDLCGADFESIARFKSELGGKLTPYFQVISPQSLWRRGWDHLRRKIFPGAAGGFR